MTSNNDIITVTTDDIRQVFPEFSDILKYPNTLLDGFINRSYCYISRFKFGVIPADSRKLAIELMTCHLTALNDKIKSGQTSGGSGQIQSASIDSVSVSLVMPPNKTQLEWWLNLTPYGQQLLYLLAIPASAGLYFGGSRQRIL